MTRNNALSSAITGIVAGLAIVFFTTFVGTCIWLLWPVVIPTVLPGLVATGAVTAKISWTSAVLFSWLTGFIFRPISLSVKERK